MSQDTSEEKVYDATQQKLRKAREKGQIAQSRDVLTAVGTIVGIVYLWSRVGTIQAGFTDVTDAAFRGVELGFSEGMALVGGATAELFQRVIVPMLIVLCGIGIFVSMVMTKGPMLSLHPLMPTFDRINPSSGFKRLFGAQAFATFGMNFVKVFLLILMLVLVLRWTLNDLILGAREGMAPAMAVFDGVMTKLLGSLAAMMAICAFADLLIQKEVFRREMRMTRTEMKSERKNMEGDPQIAAQRKQIARRAAERPSGVRLATFAVTNGNAQIVALRYVDGETPVPVVVARARGDSAPRLLKRLPADTITFDDPITADLWKTEPGDYVAAAQVALLAQKMRANGAL